MMADTFSNSQNPPPVDSNQDIDLVSGMEQNGITQIVFRRRLRTDDQEGDVELTNSDLFLSWAYHSTFDDIAVIHDQRGMVGVNFFNGQTFQQNSLNAGQILLIITIGSIIVYSFFRWIYLSVQFLSTKLRKENNELEFEEEEELDDLDEPVQSPTEGSVYFKGSESFAEEDARPPPDIENKSRQTRRASSTKYQEKELRPTWSSWILSFTRGRVPLSQINVFDSIAFFFYVVLHFIIIYGYSGAIESWNEADNWGYAAAANLFLLMLPATR